MRQAEIQPKTGLGPAVNRIMIMGHQYIITIVYDRNTCGVIHCKYSAQWWKWQHGNDKSSQHDDDISSSTKRSYDESSSITLQKTKG